MDESGAIPYIDWRVASGGGGGGTGEDGGEGGDTGGGVGWGGMRGILCSMEGCWNQVSAPLRCPRGLIWSDYESLHTSYFAHFPGLRVLIYLPS